MKKLVVYIFLSLYVFAQVKPLTLITRDAIAHTFWRMEHMATVHYENGHYHLHTELKSEAEKANKEAQQKSTNSDSSYEIIAHTIAKLNLNFQFNSSYSFIQYHQSQAVLAGFTKINSPPPKA